MIIPAVKTLLLHHSAVDIGTDCRFVSTGYTGNGGYACSYRISVTSVCCG